MLLTLFRKMVVKWNTELYSVVYVPLGRWGYHWEKTRVHKKYYD